jgi:hypothetical protein
MSGRLREMEDWLEFLRNLERGEIAGTGAD